MPTGKRKEEGFTYIGLLIAVVIFGLGSVGAARLLASTERAEREAELLFVGHQFRQAIQSYVRAGPNAGQYPAKLEDLLLDPRFPVARRHLRQLFADPITGNAQWGLVMAPEGGIMGIYSRSEGEPLKRANFDADDSHFAAKVNLTPLQILPSPTFQPPAMSATPYSYRDWQFVYRSGTPAMVSNSLLGR